MKIELTQDHRTLGKAGTIIEMPEENVEAWIDSGKAKKVSSKKESSKSKESKKA